MKCLYLFDICGTIYHSNTTFDFLEFYLKDNKAFRFYRSSIKPFLEGYESDSGSICFIMI